MRLLRTVMVVMIALSVAMLPTAGSAAFMSGSKAQAASGVMSGEMAMPPELSAAMHHCCPHHLKRNPAGHSSDQCPMAVCAAQAFVVTGYTAFDFRRSNTAGRSLAIPADQVLSAHRGSPPFRPPRV